MSSQARILVIDDDPGLLEAYKDILQGETALEQADPSSFFAEQSSVKETKGFDFSMANQGQEGVQMARQALAAEQPYAVAFIDMRMPPGWDGLTTAQALRALDPNIYLVIVSAFSDHSVDEIHSALEYDVLFLRKPFVAEEIYQMARNLTEGWKRDRELEAETQRRIRLEKRSEYLAYQAGMASESDVVLRYIADHIGRVRNILDELSKASALAPINQGMNEHIDGIEDEVSGAEELRQHLNAMRSLHIQAQELETQTIKQPLHRLQEEVEEIASTLAKQHEEFGIHDIASQFNLCELISDLITVHTDKLLDYNLVFDQGCSEDKQFYLPRNQVLQAIYNLVISAVASINSRADQEADFDPTSDGTITITVQPNDVGAIVHVRDNGVGCDESHLKRYQQAIAQFDVNAGLGVYSVAKLADNVGGSLQVHSDGPNQGCVYSLLLPTKAL